ncbi:MAG: hypothetical protein M3Q49_20390 [Actinomycetota bacterium]|nr:hypothetical protein [Actinomycetota bacterium]
MSGPEQTPGRLGERYLETAYDLAKTRPRGVVNSYAVAEALGLEDTGENITELDGTAKDLIRSGHLAQEADEPGMFRITGRGRDAVLLRRRTRP